MAKSRFFADLSESEVENTSECVNISALISHSPKVYLGRAHKGLIETATLRKGKGETDRNGGAGRRY